MNEFQILGERPPERADAARNRTRILAAAEALFAERGVDQVSMDEVASSAGVGKGTLYRRFGDRAGLGIAVLDARERDLQEAILRGAPPLGPGAAPASRLHAFVDAYLAYLDRNLDLVVMCETAAAGARYRTGVYAGWRRHVELLLREARREPAAILADYLLAALAAELQHDLIDRGISREAAGDALHELIDRIVGPNSTRQP